MNQFAINDNQQLHHVPIIPHISERPDRSLLHLHYNPYAAGDRAHEIEQSIPVELRSRYAYDDNDIGQHYTQSSHRSNPPLFYDDTATDGYGLQNRQARTRHNGDRSPHRQHIFNGDTVYIDTMPRNREETRVPIHNAWAQRDENNANFFHLNPSDLNNDFPKRNDYHEEYMMAKQSVVNTKNMISSIHDELQHIVSDPLSDNYHA
jgi:hypothetical protein